jgi:hypothetical protein
VDEVHLVDESAAVALDQSCRGWIDLRARASRARRPPRVGEAAAQLGEAAARLGDREETSTGARAGGCCDRRRGPRAQ